MGLMVIVFEKKMTQTERNSSKHITLERQKEIS